MQIFSLLKLPSPLIVVFQRPATVLCTILILTEACNEYPGKVVISGEVYDIEHVYSENTGQEFRWMQKKQK